MSESNVTSLLTVAANQRKKEKQFWRQMFSGEWQKVSFPYDINAAVTTAGALHESWIETRSFDLPADLNGILSALAKGSDERLFIILAAGVFLILKKYSGKSDLTLGFPIEAQQAHVNPVNRILASRQQLDDSEPFRSLLNKVRQGIIQATEHQNFPIDIIAQTLEPDRAGEGYPLFDAAVLLTNIHRRSDLDERIPSIIFSFTRHTGGSAVSFAIEYNARLYLPQIIDRLATHFTAVVRQTLDSPDIELAAVDIVGGEERKKILHDFSGAAAVVSDDTYHEDCHLTVPALFQQQASRTPGLKAVVCGGKAISYDDLKDSSDCIAAALRYKGCGPDTIIALIFENSIEMIAAVLGTLKAGAAYLPVDPGYPRDRVRYILEDSRPGLVIAGSGQSCLAEPIGSTAVISCDELIRIGRNIEEKAGNEGSESISSIQHHHLAYIIYTSGSTGRPKGVMIDHRAFTNFTTWAVDEYGHTSGYQVLLSNSYAFDGSVQQIFPTLISGGTLHLIHKDKRLDIPAYTKYLKDHKINNIDEVPVLMNEIINQADLQNRAELLPDLTCLSLGSEYVPIELIRKCRQYLNHNGKIINGYGPAEASVEATTYHFDGTSSHEISLIGTPRRSTRVYILDMQGQISPIGIGNEICISGVGLARGYLNRPELTREKFIANPHSGINEDRLYRTGDMGCWMEDGNIKFLGRVDSQVSIRGHRVELGEIERCIRQIPGVEETVVTSRQDRQNRVYLCAYYSSAGTEGGEEPIDDNRIREFLTDKLPAYMIPPFIISMERFPLTPNGKVNRKALPEPERAADIIRQLPVNEVEQKLVDIWSSVLGCDTPGTNENFFKLGGDSIKAIQIQARMNSFGYRMEVRDIFSHSTIAQLARVVKTHKRQANHAPVTGEIPLTPDQCQLFASGQNIHHYNHAIVLVARQGLDEQLVRQVFTRLQNIHDVLRITFKQTPAGVVQTCNDRDFPLDLQVHDLRHMKDPGQEMLARSQVIQASFCLETGPLMKLALFRLPDGDRLLIVIHHLIVDGISWRILFEDIQQLAEAYKLGKEPMLNEKTASFKQWSRQLNRYARSNALRNELDYWKRIEDASPPPLPKDFEQDFYERDAEVLSFTLSHERTEALLTRANAAFNTEINDILLTALGLAVRAAFGVDTVCIDLEGHGRESTGGDIDITRTVGWFSSNYPVLLDMSYAYDLSRQVKEVKETLHRVPNKGIGYGILKYLTPASSKDGFSFECQPSIEFNYMGQFDSDVQAMALFEVSRESAGSQVDPDWKFLHHFNISGMVNGGNLKITLKYSNKQYKRETAQTLLEHVEEQLNALISFCASREQLQYTPCDFTYKHLSIAQIDALTRTLDVEDIYPMSPLQEGMLFHSLQDPNSSTYLEQGSYRLNGQIKPQLFKETLNRLCQAHDILRTTFLHDPFERPLQVVLKERSADFTFIDIRDKTTEERNRFLEQFLLRDRSNIFSLSDDVLIRFSLIRLDEEEYHLVGTTHHILMDGWCMGIINTQFFEIYHSLLTHLSFQFPKTRPYKDYIQWLESKDRQESAQFWNDYLTGYEGRASLPLSTETNEETGYDNEEIQKMLDERKTAALYALAARHQVTLNTVLQSIWAIILGIYSSKKDVVFGSIASGRPSEIEGVETMLGLFINTIPVRIRLDRQQTFGNLLTSVQQNYIDSEPHQWMPLAEIQAQSSMKYDLLDHIYVFQNFPMAEQIEGLNHNYKMESIGLSLSDFEFFAQTNYNFNILFGGSERLMIRLLYNKNGYEKDFILKLAGQIEALIDAVLENSDILLSQIDITPPHIREQKLSDFNRDLNENVAYVPIQLKLKESFAANAGSVAVEYRGQQWTYRQLEHRASAVTRCILENKIECGSFIGIYCHDRVNLITAITGILNASCVFVPLDPRLPNKRIRHMIAATGLKALFVDSASSDDFSDKSGEYDAFDGYKTINGPTFELNPSFFDAYSYDSLKEEADHFHRMQYHLDHPVYVYFTSGSTGVPNPIVGINQSLVHFIQWEIETFSVDHTSRVSQLAAAGFDAFLRNVFTPLLAGGTVCIPDDPSLVMDSQALVHWLDQNQITLVHCVPSVFRLINSEHIDAHTFARLQFVVMSGEPIDPAGLQRWYDIIGHRVQLVNCYGATETTIIKTCHFIQPDDTHRLRIPVGLPMSGCKAIILNEDMNVCDRGISGECYIRTPYGTAGYLDNPELNSQRFISNPFLPDDKLPLYRTGDLARELENGDIEILGRIDRQIKIRGVRIEPESIEHILLRHDAVDKAVVNGFKDKDGQNALCAYVVPKHSKPIDAYTVPTPRGDILVKTPARPIIADLNELPFPDRSCADYQKYTRYIGQSLVKNSITLLGSRGCPFKCAYCHKIWPKKQLSRSAENIFNELSLYYDIGFRRFVFLDDVFNLDVKNTRRLFQLILDRGLDVQLCLNLRGDILTRDYIDLMVKTGVIRMAFALETGSPRLQKLIGKHLNLKRFKDNMDYIARTYPQVMLEINTMHGFPTETPEEARQTLEFIKSLKWLHFAYINILKIYPNTEMERLALEHGVSPAAIRRSAALAYHELPDTLPFDKSFTLQYQLEFMSDYFLLKERLLHVLPFQLKVLTEDELVQKYNSYLPVHITRFEDILAFAEIDPQELNLDRIKPASAPPIPGLNAKLKQFFAAPPPAADALRILLLDVTQFFHSDSGEILYDVVEAPLGLMYLSAYLKQQHGSAVHCKIAKSRIDYDDFDGLKMLIHQFKPQFIGIRALTYFKEFFHRTVEMIRSWHPHVPIVAGGPYATSDYATLLRDPNIDLAVIGEGELTLSHLAAAMIKNNGNLPDETELRTIPGLVLVSDKPSSRQLSPLPAGIEEIPLYPEPQDQGERNESFASLDAGTLSTQLRQYLSQHVPDYMIPSYIVPLEDIPLTSNGKIDRKVLPEPGFTAGDTFIPPSNEIETRMVKIWSEVLNIEREDIGMDANFFQLGGHSLKATMLITKIHKELNIKVPLSEIFKIQTIGGLSRYVIVAEKEDYQSIQPVEKREYYELSHIQRRMYAIQKMEPNGTAYNMPAVIPLDTELDIARIKETFIQLIRRHESLRTSFIMVEEKPYQRVHDEVTFEIMEIPASRHLESQPGSSGRDSLLAEFVRPFDLSAAPLLRAGLAVGPSHHLLLVDMHHIISDGTSGQILRQEFNSMYNRETLPPLKLQYKDYCQWQNNDSRKKVMQQQEQYWMKTFSSHVPVLELPTDFPRSTGQPGMGAAVQFQWDEAATAFIKELAAAHQATSFIVILAVLQILFAKLADQEEIVTGTVLEGRRHDDLRPIIGMFVNLLALKNKPSPENTFLQFLLIVKHNTLEAFENQEYPFESLVEKVSFDRQSGRNPLVDVVFSLLDVSGHNREQGDNTDRVANIDRLKQQARDYSRNTAKFDLTITAYDFGSTFAFTIDYNTALFKKETIDRFVTYLQEVVAYLQDDQETVIQDIRIACDLVESNADVKEEDYMQFNF